MKIRTQFSDYQGTYDDVQSGDSETVPDMSISLRELITSHTRGINVDIANYQPQFFDSEIPRIQDFTDLDELRLHNQNIKKNLEHIIQQEQAAAAAAASPDAAAAAGSGNPPAAT